ncbi:hypothetical protein WR25_06873 [Diploscapter pachys]|uniref:Uncharacterized protein n=1 Tax=Diploscapter pachys TaxID=2018661 RepID=A0A2A2JN08_9BILA|nr:hypothetical protein WR25_06873 [Diploscapter pachys]
MSMSHYGSQGNLNFRDRGGSPAYTTLSRHQDNYNRFETERHAHARQNLSEERDGSRFSGFGDRPGSGVELTGHNWQGGELITDPNQLPKSVKSKKFYYSPIGDGTVAADGYELKRRPVDLSPRVTITQLQHIERGDRGKDGVNVYEKTWSNVGSMAPSEGGFLSEYGPGSGRSSRAEPGAGTGTPKPDFGNGLDGKDRGPKDLGPKDLGGLKDFGPKDSGPKDFGPPVRVTPTQAQSEPYRAPPPAPPKGDPFAGLDTSVPRPQSASSLFSDPAYKLDMRQGYLIANPRELIHQYATMTPVAIMEANDNTPATMTVSKQSMYRRTEETSEETFAPYAPYRAHNSVPTPTRFVKQLRDDTMTHSQREANQNMNPLNQKDPQATQRISEIRNKTAYSR